MSRRPQQFPPRLGDTADNPFLQRQPSSDEMETEPVELPPLSADTIAQRQAFRNTMFRETHDHRLVHEHGGMRETCRNILAVLYDRQCYGGRHWVRRRERPLPKVSSHVSPSLCDSPISTTAPMDEETEPKEDSEEIFRVSYPRCIVGELYTFAEYASATRYHSAFLHHLGGNDPLDATGKRPTSSKAVSTIAIAFAPDALTMASTHGDHTVKITCCGTGRLLRSLEGHPRTPWTVKYHPTDSRILASGCLGHQVRVWNWNEDTCLQMVRLEFAIISLSFHPSGSLLAVANGTRLHFWGVDPPKQPSNERAHQLTEMDLRHMLRCVHFPPDGRSLIIGGVNPTSEDSRRRNRTNGGNAGMSFYLRYWDFDMDMAFQPSSQYMLASAIPRRAINNPRTFVPRALLYNDGGFDVSPDGKSLCVCAEYWLPEGVDSAMELLHKEEAAYWEEQVANENKQETADDSSEEDPELTESPSAVSAALSKLKSITSETRHVPGRSPSFRDTMVDGGSAPRTPTLPATPGAGDSPSEYVPRTPENPRVNSLRLSPPSPPGRRAQRTREMVVVVAADGTPALPGGQPDARGYSTPPPPPAPSQPPAPGVMSIRPPHPLSLVSSLSRTASELATQKGRYVPHVVVISLDTTPFPEDLEIPHPRGKIYGAVAKGYRPRLGQLLEASPLDSSKASAVTCVKFSPSTDFMLIGYGVREPGNEGRGQYHPVTSLYRVRGGMEHVSTMLSGDDDVNIARFHPDPGYGLAYGTKQGRVRILSPRPWMYSNC